MKVVVVLVAIGALSLLAAWRHYGGSASAPATKDFGFLNAGEQVKWIIPIENKSDGPMLLEGFDKACGLIAVSDSNGIVPAHQTRTITLAAHITQAAGPSGVNFRLSKTVGGDKSEADFSMTWVVRPQIGLSDEELWFSPTQLTRPLDITSGSGDETITCVRAPKWIAVSERPHGLVLTADKKGMENGDDNVLVRVSTGSSETYYTIPVHVFPKERLAWAP